MLFFGTSSADKRPSGQGIDDFQIENRSILEKIFVFVILKKRIEIYSANLIFRYDFGNELLQVSPREKTGKVCFSCQLSIDRKCRHSK